MNVGEARPPCLTIFSIVSSASSSSSLCGLQVSRSTSELRYPSTYGLDCTFFKDLFDRLLLFFFLWIRSPTLYL